MKYVLQVNKDVAFSEKVTLLNTDLPFLENKPVSCLCFAADQGLLSKSTLSQDSRNLKRMIGISHRSVTGEIFASIRSQWVRSTV